MRDSEDVTRRTSGDEYGSSVKVEQPFGLEDWGVAVGILALVALVLCLFRVCHSYYPGAGAGAGAGAAAAARRADDDTDDDAAGQTAAGRPPITRDDLDAAVAGVAAGAGGGEELPPMTQDDLEAALADAGGRPPIRQLCFDAVLGFFADANRQADDGRRLLTQADLDAALAALAAAAGAASAASAAAATPGHGASPA